jgi:hypothetical protein
MTLSSQDKVYKLTCDLDFQNQLGIDSLITPIDWPELREANKDNILASFSSTKPYVMPEVSYFKGNVSLIKELKLDYPYSSSGQASTLMSVNMLSAFLKIKNVPHLSFPVIILDNSIRIDNVSDLYSGEIKVKSTEKLEGFVRVQLLEHIDAFDWEKSKYTRPAWMKDQSRVGDISELVLKRPPSGFPPLFRLSVSPTELYVSREARESLKAAQIRGVAFKDLNRSQYDVDNPVVIPKRDSQTNALKKEAAESAATAKRLYQEAQKHPPRSPERNRLLEQANQYQELAGETDD